MSIPQDELEKLQRAFSSNPKYQTSTNYTGKAKKRRQKKKKSSAKQRKIDHLSNKERSGLWNLQKEVFHLFEKNSKIVSRNTPGKQTKKDVKNGLDAEGIWSKSQWVTYTKRLKSFTKFCFEQYGVKRLGQIKPKMVGDFLQMQLDKGNAVKTVRNYLSGIQKLSEFGEKEGMKGLGSVVNQKHIDMVPDYSKDDYRRGKKGGYEIRDVQKMASAASKYFSLHHRNAIEVLGYAGPRLDEFLRIKWSNVDFENNRINLTDTHETKGSRPRFIPVPEKVMKNLKSVYDLHLHKTDDQSIWGDKMNEKDVRNFVKEVARKGGAKYSGVHDFRRSTVKYQEKQIEKQMKKGKLTKEDMVDRILVHMSVDPKLNPYEKKKKFKYDKNGNIISKKRKNGTKYFPTEYVKEKGEIVMGYRYTKEDLMKKGMKTVKDMLISQILGHGRPDITAIYRS
jgi:integrase